MTCIVAITKNDKVYMAGDSCGTQGDLKTIHQESKIFMKSNILFGCSGSFRMIDIIKHSFEIPLYDNQKSFYEYLCNNFIDTLQKTLELKGFRPKWELDQCFKIDPIMIAYKDSLYVIQNDYQVTKKNIFAIGSSQHIALGSLYTSEMLKVDPEESLKLALLASEKYINSVSQPFNFLNT